MLSYAVEIPDKCGECGNTSLRTFEALETIRVGPPDDLAGYMLTVSVPYHICIGCGFEFRAWPGELAIDAARITCEGQRDGFHL